MELVLKSFPGKDNSLETLFWDFLIVFIVSSRVLTPPWNIDLTPFYLTLPPDSFFKEIQDFISRSEIERWNMNIQLQNLKIKGKLGFF